MERKLKKLFDYQKFARNPRLYAMLVEAEGRYKSTLEDDDLEFVTAAGDNTENTYSDLLKPINIQRNSEDF